MLQLCLLVSGLQERAKTEPVEGTARPAIRSTSAILQSSPLGAAELARSGSTSRAFSGIFTPSERGRITFPANSTRSEVTARVTTAAKPIGFSINALPANSSFKLFQPDAKTSLPQLFFGTHSSIEPPVTLSHTLFCKGEGKVSFLVKGAAFKVTVVKTTEWIDSPSGGTEKQAEYSQSGFTGRPGMMYTVYVQFDPKAGAGTQFGTLTINEPERAVEVPLFGESFEKKLDVFIKSSAPSKSEVMPGENFHFSTSLEVNLNTASQVFVKSIGLPGSGNILMSQAGPFSLKQGINNLKLPVQAALDASDAAEALLPVGVFEVATGKLLSSASLRVAVKRQWAEWNYSQKAGNSTVWGRFQLANTGEFIWSVEAHNSSWIYPDRVFHAVCLTGQGPGGISPGTCIQRNLPGKKDRFLILFVGRMELTSWDSARKSNLSLYLANWDGNPWFNRQIEFFEGVLDLTGIYEKETPGLVHSVTYKQSKWLQEKKFVPSKLISGKGWFK